MRNMFAAAFIVSIAVAAAGLAMPFAHGKVLGLDTITVSLLLSTLWLALSLFVITVYRTRGLWLLLGMPFAAAMPALIVVWRFIPCPPGGCL